MCALPPLPPWHFNRLLARIPAPLLQAWQGHLERVFLQRDQCLYEPHQSPAHVHFPLTALVSLAYAFDNGHTASIAVTGHEGLIGLHGMIERTSPTRVAVVQVAGHAWRVPTALARETFLQDARGLQLLLRYMHSVMVQIGQIGLCRGEHSVMQRLSRLLLMCDDRLPLRELPLTQERLSQLMGVRREGITRALWQLSEQGLIATRRGHLELLDRSGLQACACECYPVLRNEIAWLLDTPAVSPPPFMPTPADGGSRSG